MVVQQTTVELYNYAEFLGGDSDFLGFRSKLPVGSAAPDFAPVALDTESPVMLSDYWRDGDVVIEFGSLT